MQYRDGEVAPEMGDSVVVYFPDFEPEPAIVIKIGKSKIRIAYDNDCIKPRTEWVSPDTCDLISREG